MNEIEPESGNEKSNAFRFYDNRQKYLLFVNTCSEKWEVAERVGMELARIAPRPPGLRVFDAGMGDGTVLTRVMRQMHGRFPTTPFFVVGKEISLEDVRLSLTKMSDRFFEHPAMVLVVTNLYYTESPWLMPSSLAARGQPELGRWSSWPAPRPTSSTSSSGRCSRSSTMAGKSKPARKQAIRSMSDPPSW